MHEEAQHSLLSWYHKHGRTDLPWRNTRNPYHIYISEMMLQQTQVSMVLKRFYFPFLMRFPSLMAIANAQESELLSAWSGLGYYSRARNIHALAKKTRGKLPEGVQELRKLPGIGRYTSCAIACFAFGAPEAIVDGNIKRVLSRFFALQNAGESELFSVAAEFLNRADSFNHNQALLDVGALICKPKNPLCAQCPLYKWCSGCKDPLKFSAPKRHTYEELELHFALFITRAGIAMKKSDSGLYKGLIGFPEVSKEECKELQAQQIGAVSHRYTKYKIKANLHMFSMIPKNLGEVVYVPPDVFDKQPISSLTRKLYALLKSVPQAGNQAK
ncbi:MAG: A/G-specific adenine glycosylase [Wolinella sp.]